jgi:hypothetical protein
MAKRGWSVEDVDKTIRNPNKIGDATDRKSGDAATAYIRKDGNRVIVNDKTGRVVQVSDKGDPNWKPEYDKSTVRDPQGTKQRS